MLKVHKKSLWKTRPVVSSVTSIMRPLSIWLDAMIQLVVHICPFYLNDLWYLLNNIKKLKSLKGCKVVTSDAQSFYTNINTNPAINILSCWFILHSQDLPLNLPVGLVLLGIERLILKKRVLLWKQILPTN